MYLTYQLALYSEQQQTIMDQLQKKNEWVQNVGLQLSPEQTKAIDDIAVTVMCDSPNFNLTQVLSQTFAVCFLNIPV
jgi:hypothetical protein